MEEKKDTIGTRFRQLRKAKHLTQEQTADALGVSLALYSRIENDRHMPSTHILIAAADLYNVNVDFLLCRSDAASATGLSPDALQVLAADFGDVQKRLETRNVAHLVVQGYSADPVDFQSLSAVLNFLLTKGRADRGSGGLLDLLRAYFTTADGSTIEGVEDGICSAGRRGFHLDSGQVAVGMYYARIQQILVQYRDECQGTGRKKKKSP